MTSWEKYVDVIALFTEDLEDSKSFYRDVFGVTTDHHDYDFRLGETIIILLEISEARDQIAPATVAGCEMGSRCQLTIFVDDVDAVCKELAERGVRLVNGPIDRSRGKRTACFQDPAGHLWEVAQDLPCSAQAGTAAATGAWQKADKTIGHVTLFVDDLERAKSFYRDIFSLPVESENYDRMSFRLQNTSITLLGFASAREMVAPATVASREAGSRFRFTNFMDPDLCDVDTACVELIQRGVDLLSGPIDRPWGKRTAVFADAGGCIWELAQNVATPAGS